MIMIAKEKLSMTNCKSDERFIDVALDILTLSRNTLLTNLRFLDVALCQLVLLPTFESTIFTDGEYLFYNPHYVIGRYKTAKEIPIRDYLHIVLHCVFRHMFISPTIDQTYWNLACDITVENIISELGIKASTAPREKKQAEYIANLKIDIPALTAERIYSYFQQAIPDTKTIASLHELFYADDHVLWYEISHEKKVGNWIRPIGKNNLGKNRTDIAAAWKSISERLQIDLDAFKKRNSLNPGSMVQNLIQVNRERYDYAAFLKKFAVMGETIKINDDEFDYVFYTHGLKLYGNMPLIEPLEYKEVKAIKEFIIVIDTSGSVAGERVQNFVQKTYNVLKSTESFFSKINLHIIQCDAEIQTDVKITSQDDFDRYLKTMEIRGLGGTDFRPVFRYVETLRNNKEFFNLKGLIYFTDGYGLFPEQRPDYHTAFVFLDDDRNNLDVPPWAIKLVLQKNNL